MPDVDRVVPACPEVLLLDLKAVRAQGSGSAKKNGQIRLSRQTDRTGGRVTHDGRLGDGATSGSMTVKPVERGCGRLGDYLVLECVQNRITLEDPVISTLRKLPQDASVHQFRDGSIRSLVRDAVQPARQRRCDHRISDQVVRDSK